MIKFLVRLWRRLLNSRARNTEAGSIESASDLHSNAASPATDDVFDIRHKHIWSDDVAADCRGGKRYREEERFPPRRTQPEETT